MEGSEATVEKNKAWWKGKQGKGQKKPVVPTVQCTHQGMPMVFRIGTGSVYASGERNYNDWNTSKIDLIVALNGHPGAIVKVNSPGLNLIAKQGGYEEFPGLRPVTPMPYISVDWPDGGIPPVDEAFIQDLCKLVSSGTNILIHCVGGHGRTGTLLTAMLLLMGRKGDVLKWLREAYCVKAVETTRQIDWLKAAHNLKTKEKPLWGTPTITNGVYNAC